MKPSQPRSSAPSTPAPSGRTTDRSCHAECGTRSGASLALDPRADQQLLVDGWNFRLLV